MTYIALIVRKYLNSLTGDSIDQVNQNILMQPTHCTRKLELNHNISLVEEKSKVSKLRNATIAYPQEPPSSSHSTLPA